MDRKAWIDERRRVTEELLDHEASTYDAEDVPITPTHRRFVMRLIGRCPSGARILDAPCGTGKYFSTILDAGCFVVGADQSSGMLDVADALGDSRRFRAAIGRARGATLTTSSTGQTAARRRSRTLCCSAVGTIGWSMSAAGSARRYSTVIRRSDDPTVRSSRIGDHPHSWTRAREDSACVSVTS